MSACRRWALRLPRGRPPPRLASPSPSSSSHSLDAAIDFSSACSAMNRAAIGPVVFGSSSPPSVCRASHSCVYPIPAAGVSGGCDVAGATHETALLEGRVDAVFGPVASLEDAGETLTRVSQGSGSTRIRRCWRVWPLLLRRFVRRRAAGETAVVLHFQGSEPLARVSSWLVRSRGSASASSNRPTTTGA